MGRWTLEKWPRETVPAPIDLGPHGWLPWLLSNPTDFSKMHCRSMGKILSGLATWLEGGR
jgi:hypothetical protein